MPFSQQNLQAVHQGMREVAQLWVSGLITDREVADHFAKVARKLDTASHLLPGLIDPNTGLRYTSDAVPNDKYRAMHERNHSIYGTAK